MLSSEALSSDRLTISGKFKYAALFSVERCKLPFMVILPDFSPREGAVAYERAVRLLPDDAETSAAALPRATVDRPVDSRV